MTWVGPTCLFFTGLFTWILGLASIGVWVGCYFECPTGRDTDFNYYVAVWTGVVAFFTGLFHMVFCCGRRKAFNKVCLWSAACCSFILLPCSLLLAILSGYLSWREWDTEQKYQKELEKGTDPVKLEGDYYTGIALFAVLCIVGVLLLIVTLIFNCYHCCGNSENNDEELEITVEPTPQEESPNGPRQKQGASNDAFYSPPPPQYVREANTHRGTAYHANYGHASRSRDYHQDTQSSRSIYQHQDNVRSYQSRSRPPAPSSSRPAAPSTYSHNPPQAMTTVSSSRNPNHSSDHRYNYRQDRGYNSQPTRMRWEEYEDNQWSFGSRASRGTGNNVPSTVRSQHTNFY